MGRTPVVFFGHGNPMNALASNRYTNAWSAVGARAAKPRAILAVSAHWYVSELAVTAQLKPPTIHDFGGFPRALFEMQYPAPGDAALVARVRELLDPLEVRESHDWGFDHGTWAVLCHAYPDADVPIVQLSIDETQQPQFHFEVGRRLRALRDENVMIIASGNVVHNLHAFAWGRHPAEPFDWALQFEARVRDSIVERRFEPLIAYDGEGRNATLSVPTPEHFLPLLYALGASDDEDEVTFPVDGIDGGSISMLSVMWSPTVTV